ncbi:UNVERIFIED_CONTAM: hypothetical protein K2H54_035763 [Gekko kuhli]
MGPEPGCGGRPDVTMWSAAATWEALGHLALPQQHTPGQGAVAAVAAAREPQPQLAAAGVQEVLPPPLLQPPDMLCPPGAVGEIQLNEVNVILVHGGILSMDELRIILLEYESVYLSPMERVWIITAKWDFTTVIAWEGFPTQSLNGTLSFALHTNVVPGFEDFLDRLPMLSMPCIHRLINGQQGDIEAKGNLGTFSPGR